jgi:hypothetical protein
MTVTEIIQENIRVKAEAEASKILDPIFAELWSKLVAAGQSDSDKESGRVCTTGHYFFVEKADVANPNPISEQMKRVAAVAWNRLTAQLIQQYNSEMAKKLESMLGEQKSVVNEQSSHDPAP